jgi:hypothetical protein
MNYRKSAIATRDEMIVAAKAAKSGDGARLGSY